jgi:chemotaxis protein MotB
MPGRAPEPEKPPNHERWIISYADFTTLLLATFVVMYAVSSINSSKFQEMAEAFSTAFIGREVTIRDSGMAAAEKSTFDFMPSPVHVPIITRQVRIKNLPLAIRQEDEERAPPAGPPDETPNMTSTAAGLGEGAEAGGGKGAPAGEAQPAQPPAAAAKQGLNASLPDLRQAVEHRVQSLDAAFARLQKALAPLIGKGEVRVSLQSLGVVIDINEVLLFNSGKADLTSQALPLIDQIAAILRGLPYQIQVNGFTDTQPIHTAQFDSNWDLSATRAISVVKRFVAAGIDPTLLVGAGFGEYHPVAPNDTPANMAMNRRVSVVVVSPVEGENPLKTPLLGARRPPAGKPAPVIPPAPR